MQRIIELLAPAKNLESGKAAIVSGADAVYIGADKFGARVAAGNSIEDIRQLAGFAHLYFAKVYATVNTLVEEHELAEVKELCISLIDAGVDALIIQDPAILMLGLPPVAFHASTQMHNHTLHRVKFLEDIGFKRVVLARELTLDEIKAISNSTTVELEAFIHGSLCVSYSGRCYLSEHIGKRSANRGECAQPCRNRYDLVTKSGKVVVKGKHLLSLHDLNLSDHIEELIESGVTTFKIEGRLKEVDYVKNVTSHYRKVIDEILIRHPHLKRSSSGKTATSYVPDLLKSFNRGFTKYFTQGRSDKVSNHSSPKATGKIIGTCTKVLNNDIQLKAHPDNAYSDSIYSVINNGDGLCWYDAEGNLTGTRVNKVNPNYLSLNSTAGLKPGTLIMRNYDKAFANAISLADSSKRTVDISIAVYEDEKGFRLSSLDEDGIKTSIDFQAEKIIARSSDTGYERFKAQMQKSGNTIFNITGIAIDITSDLFIPISVVNEMRRKLLDAALESRKKRYDEITASQKLVKASTEHSDNVIVYPSDTLTKRENITNSLSEAFYARHGYLKSEKKSNILMTTKMCIKYELGLCHKYNSENGNITETLYLRNKDGALRLDFNCHDCVMHVKAPD